MVDFPKCETTNLEAIRLRTADLGTSCIGAPYTVAIVRVVRWYDCTGVFPGVLRAGPACSVLVSRRAAVEKEGKHHLLRSSALSGNPPWFVSLLSSHYLSIGTSPRDHRRIITTSQLRRMSVRVYMGERGEVQ